MQCDAGDVLHEGGFEAFPHGPEASDGLHEGSAGPPADLTHYSSPQSGTQQLTAASDNDACIHLLPPIGPSQVLRSCL
jgi:hypothetical protein